MVYLVDEKVKIFIYCNMCTTLIGGVDNGGSYGVWGKRVSGKSVPSPQFCCELKLLLKKKKSLN